MKKLLALLCTLLMALPALAEGVTLAPMSFEGVPEEMRVISIGPTGILLVTDGESLSLVKKGKLYPVKMDASLGAGDEYGNLAYLHQRGARVIGSEGVVWSPDGRYIAITNSDAVLKLARMEYDPLLIDTKKAQMFLAATYPSKFKEGPAVALSIAFSPDSDTLYTILLDRTGEAQEPFTLTVCNLKKMKTTPLLHFDPDAYMPGLHVLGDGSLIGPHDDNNTRESGGVNHYAKQDGAWSVTTHFTGVPLGCFYPEKLYYSAQSGKAILNGGVNGRAVSLLQVFEPENGFAGMDYIWGLSTDMEEMEAVLPFDLGYAMAKTETPALAAACIHALAMSPDGNRAMLLCSYQTDYRLLLLSLEDMSLAPVSGVDESTLLQCAHMSSPYLSWPEEDVFLMGIDAARTEAYKIE